MEPDPVDVRAGFEAHYREKWSGHDGFWLDWYPPYLGLYADLLRQRNRALAAIVPHGLTTILDCGCGVGDVSALLRAHARTLVSLDLALANLGKARRNLGGTDGQAALVCAGAEALPFASGRFDAVVLADVIEHVPGRTRAVAELHRVLRPGGLLVIVTPDGPVLRAIERVDGQATSALRSLRSVVRRLGGRPPAAPAPAPEGAWEQFLDHRELAGLVRSAGFTIREHRNICFYPGPEGGGAFSTVLAWVGRSDTFRRRVFEPVMRPLFAAVARLGWLNQKQLLTAVK